MAACITIVVRKNNYINGCHPDCMQFVFDMQLTERLRRIFCKRGSSSSFKNFPASEEKAPLKAGRDGSW
jgi:hypothetical protein